MRDVARKRLLRRQRHEATQSDGWVTRVDRSVDRVERKREEQRLVAEGLEEMRTDK